MDYLCTKFGDFSFSRFGFTVRTDRQTDRQTDRITDAAKRLSYAPVVGASEYYTNIFNVLKINTGKMRKFNMNGSA